MADSPDNDPTFMADHLFPDALSLNFGSAISGNPEKQTYSICPRYWYIDATFRCAQCKRKFLWLAKEQKLWFEQHGFWVFSTPKHCPDCRKKRRSIRAAKQEYDAIIQRARNGRDLSLKARAMALIEEMGGPRSALPKKILDSYQTFQNQLQKAAEYGDDVDTASGQ